jgi:hypothetical protein
MIACPTNSSAAIVLRPARMTLNRKKLAAIRKRVSFSPHVARQSTLAWSAPLRVDRFKRQL